MDIKIIARDDKGNVASVQFLIHITESESRENAISNAVRFSNDTGHDSPFIYPDDGSPRDSTDAVKAALNSYEVRLKGRISLDDQIAMNSIRRKSAEIATLFKTMQ